MKRNGEILRKQKENFYADAPFYLMLFIPTLFFIIFCYLPMFGIIISFQNFKVGSPFFGSNVKWVGLQWFKQYFSSMFFARTIRNTVILNVIYLVQVSK